MTEEQKRKIDGFINLLWQFNAVSKRYDGALEALFGIYIVLEFLGYKVEQYGEDSEGNFVWAVTKMEE